MDLKLYLTQQQKTMVAHNFTPQMVHKYVWDGKENRKGLITYFYWVWLS